MALTTKCAERTKELTMEFDALSRRVIGLAIDVHRELGPGLLESTYEQCLAYELTANNIQHARQLALAVRYKDKHLDCGYRVDLMIENRLIIELKSVEQLLPIHKAQLLTYMRLAASKTGLLINFNAKLLKNGIKRFVL